MCPQFDVFYPDLSTKEHLLFFARLRGTRAKDEAATVVRSDFSSCAVTTTPSLR